MSVVGIDFGNLRTIIAVCRNRGVDVIINEVSNRATPSKVSFGSKQRYVGEPAETQEVSNFKNTVGSIKRLTGRKFQEKEIQEKEQQFINAKLVDVDGQVGVEVTYLGELRQFSNVQLIAMLLNKVKKITTNAINIPVSDCVISVPGWFTDCQRRAILDACRIVNLNCLRLLNEHTATALGYGIPKQDLPEDKPRNVAFVDIGHSTYTTSIVSFIKGQLTVKSVAYDRHFGGRNFDQVIVHKMAALFKEKTGLDIFTNGKALHRMRTQAEKLKKILSANLIAPMNIESLMNDMDFSQIVKREDFESWMSDTLDRIESPLSEALATAGLSKDDIDSIELVGGSTRIPIVKDRIKAFFGKELSTTLNLDEAVARGCALQCAILSPVFKVRDFRVHDIINYPIKVTWEPTPEEEETEIVVFDNFNSVPSTKVLTFHRKEPFDIEAYYSNPDRVPSDIQNWLGRFSIKNIMSNGSERAQVKVKTRMNIHGIMNIESAYVVEEKIEEVKVEEPVVKEGEEADANPSTPVTKKIKKLVKTADLPVVAATTSIDNTLLNKYVESENQMSSADKLVFDTEEKKNLLEEYVYEIRGKLEGSHSDFIDEPSKARFLSELNTTEEWLYGEGETATKSVFATKYDKLRETGLPITSRYREMEERPQFARLLQNSIDSYTKTVMSGDESIAHLTVDEKQSVVDKCAESKSWLDKILAKEKGVSNQNVNIGVNSQITKNHDELVNFVTPILSKPKPRVEPPPQPTSEEAPENNAASEENNEESPEMEID